jgi:endogenous inhibitor of DNA gyrase (YacG/DUF329 family)
MTIFIEGSRCPLCGKPIINGQKSVLFPSFVANEADPLWRFSGRAFHEDCIQRDPLASAANLRLAQFNERRGPSNRQCQICNRTVTNPDEFVPFGHLTDDRCHALFKLNFAVFHRSCLPNWPELPVVYELAKEQFASGAWKGQGMQWLLSILQNASEAKRS